MLLFSSEGLKCGLQWDGFCDFESSDHTGLQLPFLSIFFSNFQFSSVQLLLAASCPIGLSGSLERGLGLLLPYLGGRGRRRVHSAFRCLPSAPRGSQGLGWEHTAPEPRAGHSEAGRATHEEAKAREGTSLAQSQGERET